MADLGDRERRVLRLTRDGELHAYAADEIGLAPVVGRGLVTSWQGLAFLAGLQWALFAASWLIVLVSWGGLAVTVLSGGIGGYATLLAVRQYRAQRVRRARGVPEPSNLPVPDALLPPAPPHPRAGRWRRRPWWWVIARGLLSAALVLGVVGALDGGDTGVLAAALAGLGLTVVVPVVLAAGRTLSSRTGSRASPPR